MQCCGINGPADWESIGNKSIPTSCCKEVPLHELTQTFTCFEPNAYKDGCYLLFLEGLKQEAVIIGSSAAIVAALQVILYNH